MFYRFAHVSAVAPSWALVLAFAVQWLLSPVAHGFAVSAGNETGFVQSEFLFQYFAVLIRVCLLLFFLIDLTDLWMPHTHRFPTLLGEFLCIAVAYYCLFWGPCAVSSAQKGDFVSPVWWPLQPL